MEQQRPPFHHRQDPRYHHPRPPPPRRFPEQNPDFYHRHPPPQSLQPPPPPPPPLHHPPLNHHPDFHLPIPPNPRKQQFSFHVDSQRHPRFPDRTPPPIFNHHHQQQPPRHHHHPRLLLDHHPDHPDVVVWDPPPLPSPPPPRPHHLHDRPALVVVPSLSPGHPRRDNTHYHHDLYDDDDGNQQHHHLDFPPQHFNFHNINDDEEEEEEERDLFLRGGECRIYRGNSTRNLELEYDHDCDNRRQIETISDHFDYVHEDRRNVGSLGIEMETEDDDLDSQVWVRDDGFRKYTGKRPRFGNTGSSSSPSREFARSSPQKKVQRMSALLRVQLGKNNSRNWGNEEYFDEENDSSFSNRGPIEFSDCRREEGREFNGRQGDRGPRLYPDRRQGEDREFNGRGRPHGFLDQRQGEDREFSGSSRRPNLFEDQVREEVRDDTSVDVSFKSNALVAKPIVTSSNHVVGGEGTSRYNGNKRKGMAPVFSVSSPRVSDIRQKQFNGSKKNFDTASNSNKCLPQSNPKVKLGGTGTRVVSGSSFGGSGTSVTVPTIKSLVVGPSRETEICEGTLNGSKKNLDAVSESNKDLTPSKTKVTLAGTETQVVGGSSNTGKSTERRPLSVVVDSGKRRPAKVVKKKIIKKIPKPGSVTKVKEGVVNNDTLKHDDGSTSGSTKASTKLEDIVKVPSNGKVEDVCPQPGQNVLDTSIANKAVTSDGICTPNGKKRNRTSPPLKVSGTKPKNAGTSLDSEKSGLNCDKGVRQSGVERIASGSGTNNGASLQSLDVVTVSCSYTSAVELVPSVVISTSETPTIKKQKTVHDCLSGFANSRKIHERPVNATRSANSSDFASSSEKGGKQQEKLPVSGGGMKEGGGLQSLDGATVFPKNNAAVESLVTPVASSAEAPMVKKTKAVQSLPEPKLSSAEIQMINKKMVHDRLSGFASSIIDGRTVNEDNTAHSTDSALSTDKLRQSEEEAPISGSKMKDGVGLHCLDEVNSEALKSLSSPVETLALKKRKSVMDRLSGFSSSREIHERHANAENSSMSADSALSSDKGLRQSEQKATTCDTHMIDNLGLQCLNGNTVFVEATESAAVQSRGSHMIGSAGMSKKKQKKKKKKKKAMDSVLDSPISKISKVTEKPIIGESDKGLRQLDKEDLVSSMGTIDDIVLQSSHLVTMPFEKSGTVESFQCPEVVVGLTNTTRVEKKKNVLDKISGSTRVTEICQRSANADIFYKGIKESEGEAAVADIQTIDDPLLPSLRSASLSISVVGSCDMAKVENIRIEDPSSGFSCSSPGEIHERMVGGLDVPLTLGRDRTQAEQRDTTLVIEECALKQYPVLVLNDSDGTHTKADVILYGVDAATSSEEDQRTSEVKAIVSGIETTVDVCSQPLYLVPASTESTEEEKSPMVIASVRDGLDKDDVESSDLQNVGSDSFMRESTFLELDSRYLLGLEGDRKRDDTCAPTMSESPRYASPDEIIEMEIEGELEGKTDMDAAKEHTNGSENLCPIELHSQMQEDPLLEFHNAALGERSCSKVVEDDSCGILANDGLPVVYNSRSAIYEPSLPSIANNQNELMDSVPERHITVHYRNNVNLDQAMHDHVIPEKKLSLDSQRCEQPKPILKSKVGGVTGRKAFQSPPIPKTVPLPRTFSAGKGSNSLPRPRTWRRMDNPSPLPRQGLYSSTGSSQRQSPKKFGKIQSTSYVRKGNSLVRKCPPTAPPPQGSSILSTSIYQLNATCKDELKGSAECESRLNFIEPQTGLGTGIEWSMVPPLVCNTKPPDDTTSSSQALLSSTLGYPLLEGGSESPPGRICHSVTEHAENQDGANEISESRSMLDSAKLKPSKTEGITYVKRKSNQLVASSSGGSHDRVVSVTGNIPTLHSSVPNDQYYKKKKNQIIRNAPSFGSVLKQTVMVPDDSSNSESQKAHKVFSMKCSRSLSKRRVDKVLVKTRNPSKFSMVWTLHGSQQQNEGTGLLQRWKVMPRIFPWKRMTQWRNSLSNLASVSKRSSFSVISKQLLLSRKRDALYTRSTGGFSLRKSKVLSIGGTNLKWSKSIESRSKKANEEATLAVAAVERKKREHKGSGHTVPSAKNKSRPSRDRVFRIGSVRYKMDASKRTLQRIPDDMSCAVDGQPGKDLKRAFIPKRLLIGDDEYVRIGNGNQLVRDPKKLVRILASEKVRWSLHTARLRMARKQQYCQFFTRFGKCNKSGGNCPYIHDPAKIAVCTKFLKGLCSNSNCELTHKVIPERMEDCSYFLQGLCTNEKCPYRHVNVNPNASVCEGFLRGYCADGNECCKKHTYVCPLFDSTGECPQGSMCKLHHPKYQNRTRKRKRSKDLKNVRGRYFGSRLVDSSETGTVVSDKYSNGKNVDDIFVHEGRLADYISLDVSDAEVENTDDQMDESTKFYDKLSDLPSDELDKLIKPLRLINNTPS